MAWKEKREYCDGAGEGRGEKCIRCLGSIRKSDYNQVKLVFIVHREMIK